MLKVQKYGNVYAFNFSLSEKSSKDENKLTDSRFPSQARGMEPD